MNQHDDLAEATPGDWLSIVHQGQDWDFPGCYGQGGDVCEGAPSPVAELDPHAAVSDVAIVTGQLGTRVGTAAIVAEWAKGLVLTVPLASDGSAATSAPKTLLTGVKNPVSGPGRARRCAAGGRLGDRHRLSNLAKFTAALTAP